VRDATPAEGTLARRRAQNVRDRTADQWVGLAMPTPLGSAAECLAKAEALERAAAACVALESRASYLRMASDWRAMSLRAAWQDTATGKRAN
jgi:hypothetical protein